MDPFAACEAVEITFPEPDLPTSSAVSWDVRFCSSSAFAIIELSVLHQQQTTTVTNPLVSQRPPETCWTFDADVPLDDSQVEVTILVDTAPVAACTFFPPGP